ncbi:hypothetical protein DL768_011144 [Monosporascus sp. mg162]|nr:hypothetical protein DL768_011144 [Monosporascus sp. mg162]
MIMKYDELPYHSSGGGSSVKGDGKSTVTHSEDKAVITHAAPNTVSRVTVPIENPPSRTAQLMRIKAETSGTNGGTITKLEIAYGSATVFAAPVPNGDVVFEICLDADELPDSPPDAITVTLQLELPNPDSSVDVHSVTLGFGESTLEDVG